MEREAAEGLEYKEQEELTHLYVLFEIQLIKKKWLYENNYD